MRVTGIVRLPPGPYRVERVRVSVRDVTELDADLDPRRTYAVRAHASRTGSASVETGDYVSTSRHVVTYQEALVVPLQVV